MQVARHLVRVVAVENELQRDRGVPAQVLLDGTVFPVVPVAALRWRQVPGIAVRDSWLALQLTALLVQFVQFALQSGDLRSDSRRRSPASTLFSSLVDSSSHGPRCGCAVRQGRPAFSAISGSGNYRRRFRFAAGLALGMPGYKTCKRLAIAPANHQPDACGKIFAVAAGFRKTCEIDFD